jgi:hypothetical protein
MTRCVYLRKGRVPYWWAFALLIVLSVPRAAAQNLPTDPNSKTARIFVDADVRVSHDGDVVHMETYAAASATNPDLLIAGGELIFPGRRANASQAQIYRSSDAGARWTPVLLPDETNGGWDNAIAGGVGDNAYFLTSNFDRGLTVYRTVDGGNTWASTVLSAASGWDRPHVAVDTTDSQFRRNFYAVGEASDGVQLMKSIDGGKTFSAPVTVCPHPPNWNIATSASPLILSDGTLLVPCLPYPNDPERATWFDTEVGLASSRDGGRTFGAYHKIFSVHRALDRASYAARVQGIVMLSGNFMQGPSFAVAPRSTQFADRIYAAWQDVDSAGASRLLTTYSADQGLTWSNPVPADSASGPSRSRAQQAVPMLAVSRDGVFGVAWFDTRLASSGKGYDVYFAASLDGGQTFLPSVRISTATSVPAKGLNILPAFDVTKSETGDKLNIQMTSPFSDRATGGDYSSMAVDAAGRFHPLWVDARGGGWQVYTATVRVLSGDALVKLLTNASCPVDRSQIQLLLDEPAWDGATNNLAVPVRILNTSSKPIVSAITVHVARSSAAERWMNLIPDATSLLPEFLDRSSGVQEHADFTYRFTPASPLFPNSASAALPWHLRVPVAEFINFTFAADVTSDKCPEVSKP